MRYPDDEEKLTSLQQTRKALQEKLLINAILDKEQLIFQAEFDGYGDSGQTYANTGIKEVNDFLSDCVDNYVTFDWYNNDGGGGDITWDVQADKITINGYYNETVRTDVMTEEVF